MNKGRPEPPGTSQVRAPFTADPLKAQAEDKGHGQGSLNVSCILRYVQYAKHLDLNTLHVVVVEEY